MSRNSREYEQALAREAAALRAEQPERRAIRNAVAAGLKRPVVFEARQLLVELVEDGTQVQLTAKTADGKLVAIRYPVDRGAVDCLIAAKLCADERQRRRQAWKEAH